jgi:hypothetical protein
MQRAMIGTKVLIPALLLLVAGSTFAAQDRSLESRVRTEIIFRNDRSNPVLLNWVGYLADEQRFIEIKPGQVHRQSTFATHLWRVRDKNSNALLKTVVAEPQTKFVAIEPPAPSSQPAKPTIAKPAAAQPQPQRQPAQRVRTPTAQPASSFSVVSTIASTFFGIMFLAIGGLVIWMITRIAKPLPLTISHWHTLIENLQTSSLDFYESVQNSISTRQVPHSSISRVDWPEGNAFSAKREYLRIRRKEHIFDICAAPFGSGFFVSWWLGQKPSFFLSLLYAIPVAGTLLERFFRPFTYYRIDTALMFQETVRLSVNEVLDAMTTAKGLRTLSEAERKPILREFHSR